MKMKNYIPRPVGLHEGKRMKEFVEKRKAGFSKRIRGFPREWSQRERIGLCRCLLHGWDMIGEFATEDSKMKRLGRVRGHLWRKRDFSRKRRRFSEITDWKWPEFIICMKEVFSKQNIHKKLCHQYHIRSGEQFWLSGSKSQTD